MQFKLFALLGLAHRPINWVYDWASMQAELRDIDMHDYWPVSNDAPLPKIPSAVTVDGYHTVLSFLHELKLASQEETGWDQRIQEYLQLFYHEGLQSWFAFSDMFVHVPGLLTDSSQRRTILSSLASPSGPIDFTLDYATRSAACSLQNSWEADVLGAVTGVDDAELADNLLYGPQGQVRAFLNDKIKDFIKRDGLRYAPKFALDAIVPLSGQFYAFASMAQMREAQAAGMQLNKERNRDAYEALKAQSQDLDEQITELQDTKATITLVAEPPRTNNGALIRPQSVTLTLQCSDAPIVLENLSFRNSQAFAWSYGDCADTELKISYANFDLHKQWSGSDGFIRFLHEYRSGTHRYTPADFPAQTEQLEIAGMQWVDIIYRQQGQQEILQAFKQAEKLNTKHKEIKNNLSSLQQEMVQKADEYASKKTTALPNKIINYCMEPSSQSLQYMRSLNEPVALDEASLSNEADITQEHQSDDKKTNDVVDSVVESKVSVDGKYYVQVGIFSDIQKVKKLLTNSNYQIDISSITVKGKKYNNVRVFNFDTQADAKKAADDISSLLKLKTIVQKQSK